MPDEEPTNETSPGPGTLASDRPYDVRCACPTWTGRRVAEAEAHPLRLSILRTVAKDVPDGAPDGRAVTLADKLGVPLGSTGPHKRGPMTPTGSPSPATARAGATGSDDPSIGC